MMALPIARALATGAATRFGVRRTGLAILVAIAVFSADHGLAILPPPALHAQAAASEGGQEVAPLDCWWRTSVSAITVGQPFTLVLTCAVVDTETATVVVDRPRLDPRAIELAPFEVLGGSVAPDVKAGDRTFFQIEYTLRFINTAFFNQDISLPNLAISYRVQTRGAAQQAATQGIERRFAMPAQSLRVSSLVPADAGDIRDAATLSFADIDAMASRGRLMTTGGLLLFGLAAAIALVGVGRGVGAGSRTPRTARHGAGDTAILRGAARALSAVRRRRADGGRYTPEDLADALAATRVVADCALDRTPSQHAVNRDAVLLSGTLALRRRWRGRRVIVSGSATAKSVAAAATRPDAPPRFTTLQAALAALTEAQYRDSAAETESPAGNAELDEVLAGVGRIANRLAMERAPIVRWFTRRAWRKTAGESDR